MSGEAKVLNGLLQRRALEEAFAELGHITDPAAVQERAQVIAGYGLAALQHLLTLLDTPDPQLRGGLGQVARHLPREQVVTALRGIARGHDRSDQARLAAVTILERFLGEAIDDALIAGLRNPDAAARQSLRELIAAMDEEPVSVVEYLEQLGRQPPEVIGMVLDALPAVESSPHLATLLRILAQGEDTHLARRAVEELAKLRTPAAVRALASLVPNLPPSLAPFAERSLRKLRFSGVSDSADHDPQREPWYAPQLHWRALISPLDALGGQLVWFIGREDEGSRAFFFTVLVQDPGGLRDASGSLNADAGHAPPRRRIGALHFIAGDDNTPGLALLEAPPEVGYAALREALSLTWASGATTPMGYRLFSPLIWLNEEVVRVQESGDPLTPPVDDELGEADLERLLDHPVFYGWFADIPPAEGAAPFERTLDPQSSASYARRLRAMGRWLAISGDARTARAAATAAYHFDASTPEASSILAAALRRLQDLQDHSKEKRNV